MSLKSIAQSAIAAAALTVATFAGTSLIGASDADAGGLHRHRHHHHHHHRFHRGIYIAPFVTAGVYGGSCYWLKLRAADTGSRYWLHRYYECRGYY